MPRKIRSFLDDGPEWPPVQHRDASPCRYAEQYLLTAREIVQALESATEQVHINRAKLFLIESYMRLRRTLPAAHRDKTSRQGHYCVYIAMIDNWE